jgi:hypothetical protein
MAKRTGDTVQVKVRMPRSIHLRLEREADRRGLTINAEILRRLNQTFSLLADEESAAGAVKNAVQATADAFQVEIKKRGDIDTIAEATAKATATAMSKQLLARINELVAAMPKRERQS